MGVVDIVSNMVGIGISDTDIVFTFHWAFFFPMLWLGSWVLKKSMFRSSKKEKG